MKALFVLLTPLILVSCQSTEEINADNYNCTLSFSNNSSSHSQSDQFQDLMEEIEAYSPGIQMAVSTREGTWLGTHGMADIPNGVSMEPCHQLMIGSISKIFTGVLIMQLHEEGILSIEDKLRDWLEPSIISKIENADEVTIEQLLTHMSGIRDYLHIEQHLNAINTPDLKETQREKLKYIYGLSAYQEPGKSFIYSNTNYVLLGLVIEKARGMTLWDAVDTYIVERLGLENCEMGTHDNPIPAGTARPYLAIRGNKFMDVMPYAVSDAATGDGGISSNMQDLIVFTRAIFNHQLLSESTVELMTSTAVDASDASSYPDWGGEEYALGIEVYHTPHGKAYGHTGSTSSYSAYLLHFPETEVTIAIAYNGYSEDRDLNDRTWLLINDVLEIVY